MHYKDGTEAKLLDVVRDDSIKGCPIIGQVVGSCPGATTCNLQVARITAVPAKNTSWGSGALIGSGDDQVLASIEVRSLNAHDCELLHRPA